MPWSSFGTSNDWRGAGHGTKSESSSSSRWPREYDPADCSGFVVGAVSQARWLAPSVSGRASRDRGGYSHFLSAGSRTMSSGWRRANLPPAFESARCCYGCWSFGVAGWALKFFAAHRCPSRVQFEDQPLWSQYHFSGNRVNQALAIRWRQSLLLTSARRREEEDNRLTRQRYGSAGPRQALALEDRAVATRTPIASVPGPTKCWKYSFEPFSSRQIFSSCAGATLFRNSHGSPVQAEIPARPARNVGGSRRDVWCRIGTSHSQIFRNRNRVHATFPSVVRGVTMVICVTSSFKEASVFRSSADRFRRFRRRANDVVALGIHSGAVQSLGELKRSPYFFVLVHLLQEVLMKTFDAEERAFHAASLPVVKVPKKQIHARLDKPADFVARQKLNDRVGMSGKIAEILVEEQNEMNAVLDVEMQHSIQGRKRDLRRFRRESGCLAEGAAKTTPARRK